MVGPCPASRDGRRQRSHCVNAGPAGQWADDVPHGEGVYRYVDGAVFHGRFRGGRREGKGQLRRADGARVTGLWIEDRWVACEGIVEYASGDRYVGCLDESQQRSGKGEHFYRNGTSVCV